MTKAVYVASPEGHSGKSAIAFGLIELLARQVGRVGLFRPLVRDRDHDRHARNLLAQTRLDQAYEDVIGVDYEQLAADPDEALGTIVARFGEVSSRYDAVVVVGSDYSGVQGPTELRFNAQIAANLGAQALLVVSGEAHTPDEVLGSARLAQQEFASQHAPVFGVVAMRVRPADREAVAAQLATTGVFTAAIPEDRVMLAPTVQQQMDALGGHLWMGNPDLLQRESLGVLIAGMTLPNLLLRLEPEFTLIVASDRMDLLPGLLLAHESGTFPNLAAMLLVGGYEAPPSLERLLRGVPVSLPLIAVEQGTYTTANALFHLEGAGMSSHRKVEVARRLFADFVDEAALLAALDVPQGAVRTPLMFEYQLTQTARADKRRIVLPESGDPRILESAGILLNRGVADLVLIGHESTVKHQAFDLGADVEGATIVDPDDPELLDFFAHEYAQLRAHKGVTLDQARAKMADPSYFGTMMVHLGMADGMVSGAINTTANTIRPSLEFIKTKPGVTIVSSSFLMCMPDRVLVFGDCAVNPDPTAEQLADIAISSAETAVAFGIEPRIAMLSYSTGTSGSGADVDKVRAATDLVRERAPQYRVEGPIQFDAAIDPAVGKAKMPGSEVAGQATVFVFPDLNTGNNTYKAVQRTSGAVAIGPVMQGLKKPVNDLSRGALVDDIVNTVAITAIQAQSLPAATTPIHASKEP